MVVISRRGLSRERPLRVSCDMDEAAVMHSHGHPVLMNKTGVALVVAQVGLYVLSETWLEYQYYVRLLLAYSVVNLVESVAVTEVLHLHKQ